MIVRKLSIAQSFVVCMLFLALVPLVGHTETFRCTAGDPGCVIASMAKANANGPEHDYLVLGPGTYTLTRVDNTPLNEGGNGLPVNTGALTILGAGQGVTWLGRDPTAPFFRIFDNGPTGGLTIYGLTIAQGEMDLQFFHRGGCLKNAGSMMIVASTIRECAAWVGGAIESRGELLLQQSVVIENFAELACGGIAGLGKTVIERGTWIGENVAQTGGGVCGDGHRGSLTIRNSVVDGNVATLTNGGGISVSGPADIRSTLISESFSALRGGGVDQFGGTITIRNSTLWDNVAEIDGGGLYVGSGEAHLTDVAVLFNSAGFPEFGVGSGGGIKTDRGIAYLERVWLLFNTAATGAECSGNIQLTGWAVIGTPNRFHRNDEPPCQ